MAGIKLAMTESKTGASVLRFFPASPNREVNHADIQPLAKQAPKMVNRRIRRSKVS
jgi:hypothetical protein